MCGGVEGVAPPPRYKSTTAPPVPKLHGCYKFPTTEAGVKSPNGSAISNQQSAHNRSSMYTPIKMLLKVSASPGQARHNGDGDEDEDEDEDRTTWTKQIRTPFPFSRGLDTSARNLQSSSQSTEETNSFRTNPCLHFAPNAKPG